MAEQTVLKIQKFEIILYKTTFLENDCASLSAVFK